jgi:membrane protein YqaA with SNARE-associated domain
MAGEGQDTDAAGPRQRRSRGEGDRGDGRAPSGRRARAGPAIRQAAGSTLERLHRLAESGWGGTSSFLWGLGQSSVVPGPAEAVLVPLGIADPPAAWRLAGWTFAGTVLGGAIAFAIGMFAFDAVRPLLGLVGIHAAELERLHTLADRYGVLLVLVSALTPISAKVVSIAAGAFGLPFGAFVITLALARGARLLVVAAILRFAGERVRRYLARGARDERLPDDRRDDAESPVARLDDARFAGDRVEDGRVAGDRVADGRADGDRFDAPAVLREEDGAGR